MGYEDYALIKKSTLTSIADLIRTKQGTTDLIDPANFTSLLEEIINNASVESSDSTS